MTLIHVSFAASFHAENFGICRVQIGAVVAEIYLFEYLFSSANLVLIQPAIATVPITFTAYCE